MHQIIADSGSSKTDWRLLKNDLVIASVKTDGCNPYFISEDAMLLLLKNKLLPRLPVTKIEAIHFYGSGCAAADKRMQVKKMLEMVFRHADVFVSTDMLGAARALLGDNEGFAAILGTGSNTCVYNGKKIIQSMDSMGYILGDEGSGAYLGKLILKEWLRHGFPPALEKKFLQFNRLGRDELLNKIYREPHPNRFLAGFTVFAKQHIASSKIRQLINQSFGDFIEEVRYWYQLPDNYLLNFTGSVSYNFSQQLKRVVAEKGLSVGKILQSPIEGLLQFHRINKKSRHF